MVELIRIRILPRNSLKPCTLSLFFENKKKGTRVRRESIKPGYESPKKEEKGTNRKKHHDQIASQKMSGYNLN